MGTTNWALAAAWRAALLRVNIELMVRRRRRQYGRGMAAWHGWRIYHSALGISKVPRLDAQNGCVVGKSTLRGQTNSGGKTCKELAARIKQRAKKKASAYQQRGCVSGKQTRHRHRRRAVSFGGADEVVGGG